MSSSNPSLTQRRRIARLLAPRVADATNRIIGVLLGLEPADVRRDVVADVQNEIENVFWPLISKFVTGEPVTEAVTDESVPTSSADREAVERGNQIYADLAELIYCAALHPDLPLRIKEAASRLRQWTE